MHVPHHPKQYGPRRLTESKPESRREFCQLFCGIHYRCGLLCPMVFPPRPPQRVSRLGCWRSLDEGFYPLYHRSYTDETDMDVLQCVRFCRSEGFLYSGILAGIKCFCGAEIDINPELLESAECNAACVGNENHQCGSMADAITVYGLTDTLKFTWARVGCFETSAEDPTLSGTLTTIMYNSPADCAGACLNDHGFFGLHNGDKCICGDEINENTAQVSDELCDIRCVLGSTCGGAEHVEVYGTKLVRPQPEVTHPPAPDSLDMTLPEWIPFPTEPVDPSRPWF